MTRAIDLVTIFHALLTLEKEFLGADRVWKSLADPQQQRTLELYNAYKPSVEKLRDLKSKASVDWQTLNEFLQQEKFDSMFDGPLDGIGVVSILDKLVQWLVKGDLCQIKTPAGSFPGFQLGKDNFQVYSVPGQAQPLVEITTQSEDKLFLLMSDQARQGVEIFDFAVDVMVQRRRVKHEYPSVRIPKVDFDLKPDIGFLAGLNTIDERSVYWFIAQAKQQFKFRMNEFGARAKVATGLVARRGGMVREAAPLVFDKPFYGWFAQNQSELPLAIFYAEYDAWKEPAGSLEEL